MSVDKIYINALNALGECAQSAGVPLYVVGGYVRDLLIDGDVNDQDIDVVVEGDAIAFAKICREKTGGELKTFTTFGTAKILKPSAFQGIEELDFASSREESYSAPGALPTVAFSSLQKDLQRRDFSINAMALPVSAFLISLTGKGEWRSAIIDLHNGQSDLKGKVIRILHEKSFLDDPTRLYRAIRYTVRLGGTLESATEDHFKRAVSDGALETISMYRRYTEVRKCFEEKEAKGCLEAAYSAGLLHFLGDDSVKGWLDEAFSSRSRTPQDEFLRQVLLHKAPDAQEQFVAAIQLGKKNLKTLLS